MIVKKMRGIKNDVRELLVKYPEYRDNDLRLIAGFYYLKYGGREKFSSLSAFAFLKDFSEGKFPLPDYITRVRRKLQEDEAELRGEKWIERHKLEQETRIDIIEL
jgi:hypothetical protein